MLELRLTILSGLIISEYVCVLTTITSLCNFLSTETRIMNIQK